MHRRPAFVLAVIAIVSLLAQPALAGPPIDHSDRQRIAAQLVELGYAVAVAADMSQQLTEADIEVLLANPGMMQRAGDADPIFWAVVIGVAIVVGLVVLASNGSGSAVMN